MPVMWDSRNASASRPAIRHFKNDFQLDRGSQWKTCRAIHQTARVLLFAEDAPVESLPLAVRETIDMEKGDGVVKSAESFGWGEATIFKVEIEVGGVPTLELQIAGNGKLIRVDSLQVEKDDDDDAE